jgi:hypothetical protein
MGGVLTVASIFVGKSGFGCPHGFERSGTVLTASSAATQSAVTPLSTCSYYSDADAGTRLPSPHISAGRSVAEAPLNTEGVVLPPLVPPPKP